MATKDNRESGARRPAVLQLVPSLDAGGAERTTLEIAGALARAGYQPLVGSSGGRLVRELEAVGGTWIPLPLDTKSPVSLVANARRVASIIRERDVALVHARSRAPAWSALWATRGTHTPFVTTWHGAYSAENALKRYYNSVMLRGDAVIANSEWTAEQIRGYRRAPTRLVVIPRGVDPEVFDPDRIATARVTSLRAEWSARDDEAVLLFPGRLSRRKGQLVLARAVAQLVQAHGQQKVRVVFAGEGRGEYADEIRHLVGASGLQTVVTFAGHVADMPAAYCAADIVVHATIEPEGFGRVAVEAGAMVRPVIDTDHGGARETIVSERSGLLVPPGDPEALAAAIHRLLDAGPQGRAAMGAAGRAHVLRHFTLARMTDDTLALYRELLGPKPTRSDVRGRRLLA